MNPVSNVQMSSAIPTTQLSSRGARYAPVKNTRIWCKMTAAIISVAAHLWSPRMNQP